MCAAVTAAGRAHTDSSQQQQILGDTSHRGAASATLPSEWSGAAWRRMDYDAYRWTEPSGGSESTSQPTNFQSERTTDKPGTKRTPGGVRPRRLDWHIDSPPDYAKAPTATTNHQQGRNGTKTVFPRTHQGNCVVQVIGLNQFRFKFWFSWSTRIFQNPARVSFTEPARARRQDEMQPVPVIPCREETTARVDVLRRQPHAGRWER